VAIPHAFFNTAAAEVGIKLPAVGEYAIGQFFMPSDPEKRAAVKAQMEATARGLDMPVLGWRTVPTDNSMLGDGAKSTEPVIEQVRANR
jgi:glutamate synthase domain-containing protein 1